jgi:hypothetical protein
VNEKRFCCDLLAFVFLSLFGKVEKMLPCDAILQMFPYVGDQGSRGPWLRVEVLEMRRLIQVHEESFGIVHPEVDYLEMLNYSCLACFIELYRPSVFLRILLRDMPASRRTTERDIELLRHFSVWYGWEKREE